MRRRTIAIVWTAGLLVWAACAAYLSLDELLPYEDPKGWLNWYRLMRLADLALMMPVLVWTTAVVMIAVLIGPRLVSALREVLPGSVSVNPPVPAPRTSNTLIAAVATVLVVSTGLQGEFERNEHFINLVAGTDTRLTIDPETRLVTWTGRLSYFMPNILLGAMAKHPTGEWTLVLHDVPGGSVDAASAVAGLADDFGIRTARVSGECYSMCANLWAIFPNLEIVEGSVIGWHGMYYADTGEPMVSSIDNALVPLLVSRGFPEPLVKRWTHLPPDRFHHMTAGDLSELGIQVRRIQHDRPLPVAAGTRKPR